MPDQTPTQHVSVGVRAQLREAINGNVGVYIDPDQAVWLADQIRLAFNAEQYQLERDQYREFARRVQRAAGTGIELSAHLAGYALTLKPTQRRFVQDEIVPRVEDWCARVLATKEDEPT